MQEGSQPPRARPTIAITMGDPNGVGPEVALRSLADERINGIMRPLLIGSTRVFTKHAQAAGLNDLGFAPMGAPNPTGRRAIEVLEVASTTPFEVEYGRLTDAGGRLAMRAVVEGVDLCVNGKAEALVTAPISKEAVVRAGFDVQGHTDFIARRVRAESHLMMLVSDTLRVGLVTEHIPLSKVASSVTRTLVSDRLSVMTDALRTDFQIQRPRIAVLGLNPHAGDGGVLGNEEKEVIEPVILEARTNGHLVYGAFAADGFFGSGKYREFDGVLSMYHDQGLTAFKALSFNRGVNFTAGLPIVRTSPDHGTAFAIAGKGKANADSMRRALYLAVDIARRRAVGPGEGVVRASTAPAAAPEA